MNLLVLKRLSGVTFPAVGLTNKRPKPNLSVHRSSGNGSPEGAPKLRVLVVDDDPIVASAMVRVLQSKCMAEVARDGREALNCVLMVEYDVMFVDLHMPGMSGIDLYERVAEISPETVPGIVFVSGGTMTDGEEKILDAIPNVLLRKPFGMGELLGLVELVARFRRLA
jgi:CheY-like chemotaxis protein